MNQDPTMPGNSTGGTPTPDSSAPAGGVADNTAAENNINNNLDPASTTDAPTAQSLSDTNTTSISPNASTSTPANNPSDVPLDTNTASAELPQNNLNNFASPNLNPMTNLANANNNPNPAGPAAPANAPMMSARPDPFPNWMATDGTSSVVEPANARKKHTGLIVTFVVLALLLLAGIGVAVWYFVIYSNPENVAFQAVSGFLQEKNISTTGVLQSEHRNSDNVLERRSQLLLKTANTGLPGTTDFTLRNTYFDTESDASDTFEIDLGTALVSDGVFYFQINKLKEAVEKIDAVASTGAESFTTETKYTTDDEGNLIVEEDTVSDVNTKDDEEYQAAMKLIEEVDGTWWRISIPDLAGEFLEDEAQTNVISNFYNCSFQALNGEVMKELAAIYQNHRFVTITKVAQSASGEHTAASGNSLYKFSLNYDELAKFINTIPDTSTAKQLYTCYNNFYTSLSNDLDSSDPDVADLIDYLPPTISAEDVAEISADDLREMYEDTFKDDLYLEISDFGHQLKGLYYRREKDRNVSEVNLAFSYAPVTVSAPSEYRNVTELYDHINEVISAWNSYDYSEGPDPTPTPECDSDNPEDCIKLPLEGDEVNV